MSLWYAIPVVAAVVAAVVGLVLVVVHWLQPQARLIVGERGILHRGLGWGWIPWEEIEGAYPPSLSDDGETVRLRLRVTRRLRRVLRKRSPEGGPAEAGESLEVPLDLAGSDLSAVDVLGEILAHRPEARKDS